MKNEQLKKDLEEMFRGERVMIIDHPSLEHYYVCLGGYGIFNDAEEEIDFQLGNANEKAVSIEFCNCLKVNADARSLELDLKTITVWPKNRDIDGFTREIPTVFTEIEGVEVC